MGSFTLPLSLMFLLCGSVAANQFSGSEWLIFNGQHNLAFERTARAEDVSLSFGSVRTVAASDLENTDPAGVLLIPCDLNREQNCLGYYKSILKYIRTFTLDYQVSSQHRHQNLAALFLSFRSHELCAQMVEHFFQDLEVTGASLERKRVDGRKYDMLFNLNHRLIMACVAIDEDYDSFNYDP